MPDEGSYRTFLENLKTRIRAAQVKAALAVNQELILLYWQIGQEILSRQQSQGWGAKVIERLAQDLKREFPDLKGFSVRNLKYMRTLANTYPDLEFGQQAVARIPWGHNCVLLDKVEDTEERLWYVEKAIENGWSRTVLIAQIEAGLYQQKKSVVTNFSQALPSPQSELAREVIKDAYNLDFLAITEDIKTQDLKRALVEHMREFLLELGVGFSFVRQNYQVSLGERDFYIDMLFYHIRLRCFVVIQLEMGSFMPEQSGLMNFYISAIDQREKHVEDQPTIGIILCKTKNRTIVEYSLRDLQKPIAVTEHRIPLVLPSEEQLQQELDNAVRQLEAED
jgi:predicted nuclease of restriction endonuclease-like (RecB) superfamily